MTGVTTRPPGHRPKQRRLRACDSCRQRKLRCDNVPGSCRNCEAYGETCIISRDGTTLRRPIHGTADTRSQRPASKSSGSPKSQASPGARSNRGGTASAAWPRPSSSGASVSALPADTESCQGVVTTEVGIHPTNAKFAGVSSAQVLGKVAEEISRPYAPHLNVMDFFCPTMTYAEEFPMAVPTLRPLIEKSVVDACVQCYYETYHNLFPILEQDDFRRAYDAFYSGAATQPARVVCIYLVIALGSKQRDIFDSHLRAAYDLYPRLIAQPFVASVQALILMTICFINAERDGQAILCIGLATQIAMSMGLHRSLYIHRHPLEFAFVFRDHNTRNCLWWVCYSLEKKLAFEHGRCSIIHDDDCDAELPVLSQSSTPSLTRPGDSFTFILSFIRLAKALSSISRSLFNRTASNQNVDTLLQRIATADDDLLAWRSSLPDALQPDRELLYACRHPDSVSEIASEMLHCVYYNALVIIHRASLVFMATQPALLSSHPHARLAASDAVCLGAARALIRTANHLVLEQSVFPHLRWMNPYAINGVMALYIGVLQWPHRWTCQTDLALMRSLQRGFAQSSDAHAAERFEALMVVFTEVAGKAEATVFTKDRDQPPRPPTETIEVGSSVPISVQAAPGLLPATDTNTSTWTPNDPSLSTAGSIDPATHHVHSSWLITPAPSDLFSVASGMADGDIANDLQFGDFFGDQSTAWNMWPIRPGQEIVDEIAGLMDIGPPEDTTATSIPDNMPT